MSSDVIIDVSPLSPGSRRRQRTEGRSKRPASALSAALLGAVLIAGCGGSSTPDGSPDSPTPPAPLATAPLDSAGVDAATAAEIQAAFVNFVDPAYPEAKKPDLLENGEAFAAAIAEQASSEFAETASVAVSKVSLDPADSNKAVVTFSLLISGSPVLADQTGHAVKEGGVWKVSDATFCSLLAIRGVNPAACAAVSSSAS